MTERKRIKQQDDWAKPRIIEYNPHYDDLTKSGELYGYSPNSELALRTQKYLYADKTKVVQKGVEKFGEYMISVVTKIENFQDIELDGTEFRVGKSKIEKWMEGIETPNIDNLLRICILLDARKQLKNNGKKNKEIRDIFRQPIFDGQNIRQVLRTADPKEFGSVHEGIDRTIKDHIR